jgi:hypothetical protein
MTAVHLSIYIPLDHCEYIEMVSLELTVGGTKILLIITEKADDMELVVNPEIVISCWLVCK